MNKVKAIEAARKKRDERVAWLLKDSVICVQCGATLETYSEKCNVPLDVRCEGFNRVEDAIKRAADELEQQP